jgi:hypothetical protein
MPKEMQEREGRNVEGKPKEDKKGVKEAIEESLKRQEGCLGNSGDDACKPGSWVT